MTSISSSCTYALQAIKLKGNLISLLPHKLNGWVREPGHQAQSNPAAVGMIFARIDAKREDRLRSGDALDTFACNAKDQTPNQCNHTAFGQTRIKSHVRNIIEKKKSCKIKNPIPSIFAARSVFKNLWRHVSSMMKTRWRHREDKCLHNWRHVSSIICFNWISHINECN